MKQERKLDSDMKIAEKFKGIDGTGAWEAVVRHIEANNEITTVSGITFNAKFVGSCIFLKGGRPGTKRAVKGEYLTAKDFISAFDKVREWDDIHTGNVKPYIKRQQTPFIALLHCAGILE